MSRKGSKNCKHEREFSTISVIGSKIVLVEKVLMGV